MINTSLRWVLPLAALLGVGPLAGAIVRTLRAVDGGHDVTLLLNNAPAMGLLVGAAALALCVAIGVPAARRFGPKYGMLVAALALLWPAWMTGRVEYVFRLAPDAGTIARMVIEGVLGGAAIIAIGAFYAAISKDQTRPLADGYGAQLRRSVTTNAGLAGSIAGALAALAVAWVVARNDLRGQAIFAAFVAGIASGVVSRLVATALDEHAPLACGYVGMAIAAVLAPLVLLVMPGPGGILDAALAGTLPGPGKLQALDWLTGAMLGVGTGLSWLGEIEHAEPAPRTA